MFSAIPAAAEYTGSDNIVLLLKSIQPHQPDKVPALFRTISDGSVSPEMLEKYGTGTSYFLALHALDQNVPEAAERLLQHASEEESSGVRSLARRDYLQFLSDRGELRKLRSAYRRYAEEDETPLSYLLIYGKALYREGRFSELARLIPPEGILPAETEEEQKWTYLFLQIYAMLERNQIGWTGKLLQLAVSGRAKELPELMFGDPEADYAEKLWQRVDEGKEFSEGERSLLLGIFAYRRGRYKTAYRSYSVFLKDCIQDPGLYSFCTGPVMDDYALSSLYSGNTSAGEQTVREGLLYLSEQESGRFWFLETRGYLLRKLGRFQEALQVYEEALTLSPEAEEERIRWYMYDSQVRISYIQAVDRLDDHLQAWNDHSYYTDVLSHLIDGLVRYERWDLIARMADILKGKVINTAAARAGYIAARAAEEGLFSAEESRIREWYGTAVRSAYGAGSGLYYRFLAAHRLGDYGQDPGFDVLDPAGYCKPLLVFQEMGWSGSSGASRSWSPEGSAPLLPEEAILQGYIRFGLSGDAYERFGKDEIFLSAVNRDSIRSWCIALQEEGHYLESIRLFNSYCHSGNAILSGEDVKLLYPRAYAAFMKEVTGEYQLPEYLFYALVREESLFDADISSGAGAVGLSQLMPSTAGDVAGRIGIEADDLTDPAVNLRLGAWYLQHLIGRTDNPSQALFAYNGGITRVRRWLREYPGLPGDLLLEKIPYEETSHYGRKVLVSSILYGHFYYNIRHDEIIRKFFGFQ